MRAIHTSIVSGIAVLVCSVVLRAAVIVPGSVLLPAASEPDPVGGTIIATLAVPFAAPGAFSGTLFSDVISGDASNPLGGLTFVYRVTNDGVAGPNSIGRLTVADFTGFATDASYNPTAGVAPSSIDRIISGDVIGFNFQPTPIDPLAGFLVPGSSSARLVVQTNAPLFVPGTAYVIDGGITSAATFAPAVPEPGMLALAGVVPMLALRRRK